VSFEVEGSSPGEAEESDLGVWTCEEHRFLEKGTAACQHIFHSFFTADYTDFSGSGRRVAARSCHGNGRFTLAGAV